MIGPLSGYGGVYKAMNVEAETMNAAKQASKMAIFEDESLQNDAETRKERNTALYVPTFFTGVPQTELHPVAAAHVDSQRFQRDANVSISHPLLKPKSIFVQLRTYYFELLMKPVHFRHTSNRLSTGSTALLPGQSSK